MPKQKTKPFKPMWELKPGNASGTLDLYIYGEVDAETWVDDGWWGYWEESENSANHFREVLSGNPNATQINIYINSYGGSVFEGTAIYNQLRRHPAHKTVYVDGFACSIASVIAMAGDEVVMPPNTLMMIHNMWMGAVGSSAELRKAADDLDVINEAGQAAYLAKAGDKLSEERLREMMDAETWLTAAQCVELGLADRVAETEADMSAAAQVMQRANLSVQQRIDFQRGLCAQLRELTRPASPPALPDDPTPNSGTPPENGILSFFRNAKI